MGPMMHMTLIPLIASMLTFMSLFWRRLFPKGGRKPSSKVPAPKTRGTVINFGWFYDVIVWYFARGREQELRQKIADLAQLRVGETVLDVGCGTGSLAIVAKERVGAEGRVCGIDPGPRQLARARAKAKRAGQSIDFQLGVIEQLAFPDQSFDIVLSSFMIDHVPSDLQRQGLDEIARVLKAGGRLFVIANYERTRGLPALMKAAGFSQIETGETTFSAFPKSGFALGRKSPSGEGTDPQWERDNLREEKGASR